MTRAVLAGSCHCGTITARIALSRPVADIELRACDCGFCRRHGARTFTDRDGSVTLRIAPAGARYYRFATKTGAALICANCGTYVAAVMATGDGGHVATINANGLGLAEFDNHPVEAASYGNETSAERRARRLRGWTPARLVQQ